MPAILDYAVVLSRMTADGFRCNYPNGGSFSFPTPPLVRGWITSPDQTIRLELANQLRTVPYPAESAAVLWQTALSGPAWIMPASHWHFEFHDGSRDWMADVLRVIQINPVMLENRPDASAIEFVPHESAAFTRLLAALLSNLRVSDFSIAFPGRPALCTVHHHNQLWWTSTDANLIGQIDLICNPTAR